MGLIMSIKSSSLTGNLNSPQMKDDEVMSLGVKRRKFEFGADKIKIL